MTSIESVGLVVSEAPSLKIPKSQGEKSLALAKKLGIFNSDFRIEREQGYLYVPLTREPRKSEINELKAKLPEFEIRVRIFPRRVERQTALVDLLSDKLPPSVLASLPHAIDFVGDIAVIEITPELQVFRHVIGNAILKAHRRARTILAKSGPVIGPYRLRAFEVLAGESKTRTVHREHGCVFHVDLAKAYFSPRLSYEHSRVASLVRPGEKVLDMFAGVGSFSILIAKRLEDVLVYAIDLNPDAVELLRKNVVVNRVQGRVKPILGDARRVVNEKLGHVADRVVMNLPERAIEFIDVACQAIRKEGGVIHYYGFSDASRPLDTVRKRLAEVVKHAGRRLESIQQARIVRGIAPFRYQVVVDAEIR